MSKQFLRTPLVVLGTALFLSTFNWYNFPAIFPVLQVEWSISAGQGGVMMGMVQVGYAVSVFISGIFSDRVNPRLVFMQGCLLAGVSGLLFAVVANGFYSGLILRFLAGLGVGALYVPGMVYLSCLYPPRRRGAAIGLFTGALSLAIAGAYFFSGIFVAFWSWRHAVFMTSLPAFAGFFLVRYRLPDQVSAATKTSARTAGTGPNHGSRWLSYRDLLMSGFFWWILLAYLGHTWELIALRGWIGPFFTASLMLQEGAVLRQATALAGTLAAIGNLINFVATSYGGWLSDRFGSLRTAALLATLGGVLSFEFGHLLRLPFWALGLIGMVYLFFVIADTAIYKTILAEVFPPASLGIALGLQASIGFGLTALPYYLFGVVLDRTTSWGLSFSLLGLGAVATLIALFGAARAKKRLEQHNRAPLPIH